MINSELKQFIEENIRLIECNNFETLYNKWDNRATRGCLTHCLISAGIDVLYEIPEVYTSMFQNYDDYSVNGYLESIELPSNIETIGNSAFCNCLHLDKIKIPKSLKRIENYAFDACGVSTLILPKSLEYIGKAAFFNCFNLKRIEYEGSTFEFEELLENSNKFWNMGSKIDDVVCSDTILLI